MPPATVKEERQRLTGSWDRWRSEFTAEQNAAVAVVLLLGGQKPSDERMAYYRRLAMDLGWMS